MSTVEDSSKEESLDIDNFPSKRKHAENDGLETHTWKEQLIVEQKCKYLYQAWEATSQFFSNKYDCKR